MIRSLWIARTGLDAQQTQLDVISNNLANVSTNGFKRSRAVFEDLLYQTLRQPGAQSSQQTQIPAGLQLGTGVRPASTAPSLRKAISRKPMVRWISRFRATAFSRFCYLTARRLTLATVHFQKDNQGQIVTTDGYPLAAGDITIPANAL
jgi:flagellar basal-body rod protein FlgG